ncbi:MFS transporter [Halococcoides cellulosivorans]|uniref:MFS transporter n=1 Tax=Halococcoides cellulosivorans TaxID=1679096 RepID=A0A2R4X0M5_9EURY|nr:MFS transporter [Halococcoides cellulosivorans]AWB27350.1 MFS transporter [Halococcoides cellulosivorans]
MSSLASRWAGVGPQGRYQLVYFVYFAAANVFLTYRNDFFESIGLTGTQMGVLGGLLVAGGLLAKPVWGVIADRTGRTKAVLVAGAVVSGLAALVYPAAESLSATLLSPLAESLPVTFLVIAGATLIVSVFRAPIVPVANAMVISRGLPFGTVRAFGSIAYGIGALASGLVVTGLVLGPIAISGLTLGPVVVPGFGLQSVFVVYAVGMALTVVVVRGVPAPEADLSVDIGREAIAMVTHPPYAVLLGTAALYGAVAIVGDVYLSVYLGTIAEWEALTGVAWLVKTVAEASLLVALARQGVDDRRAVVLGAVAFVVGFATLGLTSAVPTALFAQVFVGFGAASMIYATVQLAHRLSPEGIDATAQTVLSAFGIGLGRLIGELVAGPVYQFTTIRTLYLVLAVGAVTIGLAGVALWTVSEPANYSGTRQSATTGK